MSSIKRHVIDKVFKNISARSKLATLDQISQQVLLSRKSSPTQTDFVVKLPICVDHENEKEYISEQIYNPFVFPDNIIKDSQFLDDNLVLSVDKNALISDVLNSNLLKLNVLPKKKKVVVEFSSPNVAKPFHAGHLRSTIIGNFISNIKKKLGHDVCRINYLGDWGTQFGLLKLGVDKLNISDDQLSASPTRTLYDAYVWVNKEAETDPTIHDTAREEFRKLENGDESSKKTWMKFINLSTGELQRTYSRLGVAFDEYQWESNFGSQEVGVVLERLKDEGLLEVDGKGRQCGRVRGRLVPLVRSDGATLYLSRDVAAALHRRRTATFNEMLYVVENGQADHFLSLFAICGDLGVDESWNMRHVKFGRIHGMSTRRGNAVFLADILDQARDLVFERLQNSKTSKAEPTLELADALGSAAVIVNDLKQRRIKDYEFNWEKALQVSGDTAVRLQYTHCRLCSLLAESAHKPAVECDPEALQEPEAVALALDIARFEEALLRSHADLESCILVNYLFHLSHAINKAFKVLPVKGSSGHIASQRLLLFNCSKLVLAQGLSVLGIVPLEKM